MGVNYSGFTNYSKMKDNKTSPKTIQKPPGWAADDASAHAVGERVYHAVFGVGCVISASGGKNTVKFDNVEVEKVVAKAFLFGSPVIPSTAEANGWNE